MGLRTQPDTIPTLTAETDQGTFALHDWIGDAGRFCLAIRKILRPLCTTGIGPWRSWPMNAARGTKVMGFHRRRTM
jgi:hypothetical protein